MRDVGLTRGPGILMALLAATLLLSYATSAEAEELPEGSCEDLLVQVDKEYSLPPLYAPPDMVFISDYGVPALGWGAMLRVESAEHLSELVNAADSEGSELIVASSYRSFYDQSLAHAFYTRPLRVRGRSCERGARPQRASARHRGRLHKRRGRITR